MDAKMIKRRLDMLENNRQVVEQQWELIREYVVPFRGQFFKEQITESSVEWRENRRVFDSTAINANNTLASSLHGAITNPAIQWFDFGFLDEKLKKNKEATAWAFDCSKIVFQGLRDSNFNLEANETYLDLTSYGTAFITKEVLEHPDGTFDDFLFQATPIVESFFEQDHRGRLVNYYRKMHWSAVMVLDKFKDDTPDNIREKALKGTDASMDIGIIFCVYKRDLGHSVDITKILGPDQRPYGFKYVLYDLGKEIGKEGGYYTMPAMSMRWRKTADSMWGNSPAMIALPDILTLNELVELILNSLEKVVDPAIITTERGLLSQLDLGPAGINVLRSMDDLKTFESRARFDVAELNREKLQRQIQAIFYVDQLELKDSPAMTATEVQVRYELMQRLLGPTMGRLESDFLDPLVMSSFADMMRYGKLPDMPQAVLEAGDPKIVIHYTGPMSRAQKLDQAASLERFSAGVAQLAAVDPRVLDIPDWDGIVRNLARLHQIDPDNLKSEAQVKRERQDREEKQARMAEAEVAEQEGKADQANAGQAGGLTAV